MRHENILMSSVDVKCILKLLRGRDSGRSGEGREGEDTDRNIMVLSSTFMEMWLSEATHLENSPERVFVIQAVRDLLREGGE